MNNPPYILFSILQYTILKLRTKLTLGQGKLLVKKNSYGPLQIETKKKFKIIIQPKNSKINNPCLWLRPFQTTSLFTNKTKTNLLKKIFDKKKKKYIDSLVVCRFKIQYYKFGTLKFGCYSIGYFHLVDFFYFSSVKRLYS